MSPMAQGSTLRLRHTGSPPKPASWFEHKKSVSKNTSKLNLLRLTKHGNVEFKTVLTATDNIKKAFQICLYLAFLNVLCSF